MPRELGMLPDMERLILSENRLTGSIPPELGQLPNLTILQLRGNELTGVIPPELGRLQALKHLSLEGNQLTGKIPPELGGLPNLINLELADSLLTGQIPPELGELSALQSLNLSGNGLTGEIPEELARLPETARVFIGGNRLSGCVPALLRFGIQGHHGIPPCDDEKGSGDEDQPAGGAPGFEMVWPVLTSVEPAVAVPGARVSVVGEGGFLFSPPNKYDESSRAFDVFFDSEPAGSIDCYVNRCEGEFIVPEGTESGEYAVMLEGGSQLPILVDSRPIAK